MLWIHKEHAYVEEAAGGECFQLFIKKNTTKTIDGKKIKVRGYMHSGYPSTFHNAVVTYLNHVMMMVAKSDEPKFWSDVKDKMEIVLKEIKEINDDVKIIINE